MSNRDMSLTAGKSLHDQKLKQPLVLTETLKRLISTYSTLYRLSKLSIEIQI